MANVNGYTSAGFPAFINPLQNVNFQDPQEVAKKETGEKIAQQIYREQTQSSTNLNFFTARAAKWIEILKWATGTQSMNQFLDYFNVSDGNKAYVKIDMTPIMIGPQFVLTLVDSICKDEEYPCVTATDEGSVQEKEDRKNDALFRMHDQDVIGDVEQKAGMSVEPPNAYIPEDELSAKVYFELEDKLPKEIFLEKKLEDVLVKNEYKRILKPKIVYDFIVHNIGTTKIEKNGYGDYCIRKPIPQNLFYNYFVNDSGKYELSYIGELYALKVRDLRTKYGISPDRPDGLTEKEIYDIAKMSSTKNTGLGFNFMWRMEYQYYNYNCPWDDYSIYAMDFEIQVSSPAYYVGKEDSYGKENIVSKKGIPAPTSDKASIYKKNKTRWYRGVYSPYATKMIYWGLPDVVILPFMNIDESLSSWSINIPFNTGQYMPSLFERGIEPLKEYAITKLKRKQLIAKLRPSGIRIDVHSARNIDLGSGNTIAWEEVVRIFDQTGNELWSSRGIDPLREERPALSATAPDDTLQKIIQLTQTLQEIVQELRGLLGVPMYRDGSDVGDRTAAALAEGQNQSSFNVTDFIPNAHNQLMEETLYKCCLLEWQDAIKKGDMEMINSKFRVDVEMKLSVYEKQQLERMIETGMANQLLSFKDAFFIRQIKNYKLAMWYLSSIEEKKKKEAQEANMQNIQANAQTQQQSLQQQAEYTAQQQRDKLQAEKDLAEFKALQDIKTETVRGAFMIASKGENPQMPPWMAAILQSVIPGIVIPLQQETKQMVQNIQQQAQQEQMMAMQQAQMEEQQEPQDNPQEEMREPQMQ